MPRTSPLWAGPAYITHVSALAPSMYSEESSTPDSSSAPQRSPFDRRIRYPRLCTCAALSRLFHAPVPISTASIWSLFGGSSHCPSSRCPPLTLSKHRALGVHVHDSYTPKRSYNIRVSLFSPTTRHQRFLFSHSPLAKADAVSLPPPPPLTVSKRLSRLSP
jgi:hypothetical protein